MTVALKCADLSGGGAFANNLDFLEPARYLVLPYLNADPVLALRLQDVGCAAVMPLGSPICSHRGLETRALLEIIIEQARVPVVVDAGLGAPSHAAAALETASRGTTAEQLTPILRRGRALTLDDFAALLSPAAAAHLETVARHSQALTQRNFGKVIRMFAPLYLSNKCVNICQYCGFSRNNPIPRITLPSSRCNARARCWPAAVSARCGSSLANTRSSSPTVTSPTCIQHLLTHFPSVSLKLGPLETADYLPLVAASCEGLVVYQETDHRPTYVELHTAGPKRDFAWRRDTVERGYAAGFRRLGIGALLGLHDWRTEALAVAAHALHLRKHCWTAYVTIWLPRLRDGLPPLGITSMSASTEPVGYSSFDENWAPGEQKGEPFHIADERPPELVAEAIRRHGDEPVWKDFDRSLVVAE